MSIQLRNRSPLGSFQAIPVSCTAVPGACPTIIILEVGEAVTTGLGPKGKWASQILQAAISESSLSNVQGALSDFDK